MIIYDWMYLTPYQARRTLPLMLLAVVTLTENQKEDLVSHQDRHRPHQSFHLCRDMTMNSRKPVVAADERGDLT
jgi:hypothetical protein